MSLKEFIQSINIESKDIIYFGGSFDPWHEGHSECLRKAPREPIKIVIPDHNPHKELNKRNLELNKEYIKTLNKNVFIYDRFFYEEKQNPTVDWLAPLSKELSLYTHSLLMGYDSYQNLNKWKNFEKLTSCLDKLYVLNRQNKDPKRTYSELETIFLGSHQYEKVSSTELRKKKPL